MTPELKKRLQDLTSQQPIMLFMKGDRYLPKCGFSAKVVGILEELEAEFTSFDILEEEEVRQGLKEFSDWPTFPQLYVNGVLVGGSDIITEMYQNGELQELIDKI